MTVALTVEAQSNKQEGDEQEHGAVLARRHRRVNLGGTALLPPNHQPQAVRVVGEA